VARVLLVVAFGVCAWQATGTTLQTSIVEFLPEGESRDTITLSGLVSATGFARGMIIDIEVPANVDVEAGAQAVAALSDELVKGLEDTGMFTSVSNGIPHSYAEEFFEVFFDRRLAFMSDRPEDEVPLLLSTEGLDRSLGDLKRSMSLPTAALVKRVADRDPIMAFAKLAERMGSEAAKMSPRVYRGHFFSNDLRHHLVFAETKAEAFDTMRQARIIDEVKRRFAALNRETGPLFTLSYTGLNRFSVESERRIKGDIRWAATASALGVALLFFGFFRRLRFLVLALAPVVIGVIAALGVSRMMFGAIHGLTLAFGSTLVGVCIDYPIHILNHMRMGRHPDAAGRSRSRRRLWRSLSIGSVTTLAGFFVLAFSSYPGFRQIAVFTISGVTFAFLFSAAVLPLFRPWVTGASTPGAFNGISLVHRLRGAGSKTRWLTIVLSGVLTIVLILAVSRIKMEDDVRALDVNDPVTVAEDAAIRSLLPMSDFPLYVLVSGDDLEEALSKNDGVYSRLSSLREDGVVEDFCSIHPFMPSMALQRRNLDAVAAERGLERRMREALDRSGFEPEEFTGFFKATDRASVEGIAPVAMNDIDAAGLGRLITGFTFERDGRMWVLTLVRPARDGDVLAGRLIDDRNVVRFNSSTLASTIFSETQRETVVLLVAGVLINVVLLLLLLRGAVAAARALLPTLLALLMVLGGMSLLGVKLNVLHVMSLLLVLCMGVDYAVFLWAGMESVKNEDGNDAETASMSIVLSALTTAMTYGFLALCETPVLAAIGSTVTAGIVLVCLLTFIFPAFLWRRTDARA